MPRALFPHDEPARLAALHALEILDTPQEQGFDDIVILASQICNVPIALVSLVDGERQWFKAKIGLEANETHRDYAFCSHAILGDEMMVVPDAPADARFVDNPLVTGAPNVRFYAGAPVHGPDGAKLGTLCIIDDKPRELTPAARTALLALKRQVECLIRLRQSQLLLAKANGALVELQHNKDALVQYVVHDMNTALQSVVVNAQALAVKPPAAEEVKNVAREIGAAGDTLRRLVFDMMDLSRHERGGQLTVVRRMVPLDHVLQQAARLFAKRLEDAGVTLRVPATALCLDTDPDLLSRVLENLVDNAVRHAPSGTEIVVSAARTSTETIVTVCDDGPGIPADRRLSVFQLYDAAKRPKADSRGIGLAFCRVATEALGGRIWVEPNGAQGSRFCIAI
ncbi:MAG: Sensor protein [Labilithrix sp.]|nr:Sensor protein [Labilithrix sp.]